MIWTQYLKFHLLFIAKRGEKAAKNVCDFSGGHFGNVFDSNQWHEEIVIVKVFILANGPIRSFPKSFGCDLSSKLKFFYCGSLWLNCTRKLYLTILLTCLKAVLRVVVFDFPCSYLGLYSIAIIPWESIFKKFCLWLKRTRKWCAAALCLRALKMPVVRLMEVYSLTDWYVVPKGVSRCLLIKTKHFFFVYLWTDCSKKSCLSRSSFWLTAPFLALFIVYGEMYVGNSLEMWQGFLEHRRFQLWFGAILDLIPLE